MTRTINADTKMFIDELLEWLEHEETFYSEHLDYDAAHTTRNTIDHINQQLEKEPDFVAGRDGHCGE